MTYIQWEGQGLNSVDSTSLVMGYSDTSELAVLVSDFVFGISEAVFHVVAISVPCNPFAVHFEFDFVCIHGVHHISFSGEGQEQNTSLPSLSARN